MTTAEIITTAATHGTDQIATDPRITAAQDLLAERRQLSALSAAQLRRLLAVYQRRMWALIDVAGAPTRRDRFQRMQALEDAIKWRRARAAEPCGSCAAMPDGRCEDHGRDVDLIREYEQAARRLGAVGAT